jgi:hypothetical protein
MANNITHVVQFSSLSGTTQASGTSVMGKSARVKAMPDADTQRLSGLAVVEEVQFIEPMPNPAQSTKKGRRA